MSSRAMITHLESEIENFVNTVNNLDKISINVDYISQEKILQARTKIKQFTEQYKGILEEIKKKVGHLIKGLELIKNMEWETINVAFFGETNAGKSTLIEAIKGGDGRTIGDGRKDFTRSVNTYEFGENVRLLDMPGIEGNEEKVKKEIWKAVEKAHLIFYVYPDNKEPEEGTLKKIKKYLRKNSEIYTVLNLRGIFPPDALQKRFQGISRVEERTNKHLKENLGDIYKGSFKVHALFSFFSRAKHIPPNLKDKYNTTMKFYGNKERLKKVSNIYEIISFIGSFTRNQQEYQLKILWGNFRKILTTQEEILARILKFKKNFDKLIKEIKEEIDELYEKLSRERKILEINMGRIIQEETDKFKARLISILHDAIDTSHSEQEVESSIKREEENFKNRLQERLEREIKDFKDTILNDFEMFQKKLQLMKTFKVKFDLSSVFEKLKYSLKDLFKEISDIVLSIGSIIVVLNPILRIALVFVNVLRKLWDWLVGNPEKKKAEAKREANQRIEDTVYKIRAEIDKRLKETYKEVERQFRKVIRPFRETNKNFKLISLTLDTIIRRLIETNVNTSLIFIKQLDPSVKFAYIQTALKEGTYMAIVTPNSQALKLKLKQSGIENVYTYSSIEELKESLKFENGEFFNRLKRVFTEPEFLSKFNPSLTQL